MEEPERGPGPSDRSDQAAQWERVALLARAGVERWARFVRPLPHAPVVEEDRYALRTLVAWYERVCVDETYVGPPPSDGVQVLSMLERCRERPADDPIAIAKGAVRVAGELVDYRRLMGDYRRIHGDEDDGPPLGETARSQLESATRTVCRFLDSER